MNSGDQIIMLNLIEEELNGYNFLLASKLGFWDELCRRKMPASKFLVQTYNFTLAELIRESSLPGFLTNLAGNNETIPENRITIPLTDQEAKITYHAVFRKDNSKYADILLPLIKSIAALHDLPTSH